MMKETKNRTELRNMTETRRYWQTSLLKIADPVLDALETGKLREHALVL